MVNINDNEREATLLIKLSDTEYEKINPETLAKIVSTNSTTTYEKNVQEHINDLDIHFPKSDLDDYALKEDIPTKVSELENDIGFLTSTTIPSEYVKRDELSTVATSGSYNDLIDKPSEYQLPIASTTTLGGVKVDGTTILINDGVISSVGGGTGGTNNYNLLTNKPSINGVELTGNKTSEELGLFNLPISNILETSGTITLLSNTVYKMVINGSTTFSLPTEIDTTIHNQIKMFVQIVGTPSISWGTTVFFHKQIPNISSGNYEFYFDYDPNISKWVAGALLEGEV